jgi:uncharacterized protein YebE (UPF0316 family)
MEPMFLFPETPLFTWVLLPLFIFCARATDVGLSTLRIVFIAQGRSLLAPLVGFFEALIWLFVIGQILAHLTNPLAVVAYAAGFAAGNSVGLFVENKLAIGLQVVRIITQRESAALVESLADAGFGVTVVDARGVKGEVQILFTVVRRRDVQRVLELAAERTPRAFLSVGDVRQASEGVLPASSWAPTWPKRWRLTGALRKQK